MILAGVGLAGVVGLVKLGLDYANRQSGSGRRQYGVYDQGSPSSAEPAAMPQEQEEWVYDPPKCD